MTSARSFGVRFVMAPIIGPLISGCRATKWTIANRMYASGTKREHPERHRDADDRECREPQRVEP
jgi:hypothetical protein